MNAVATKERTTPAAKASITRVLQDPAWRQLLVGVLIVLVILFGDNVAGRLTSGSRLAPELQGTASRTDVVVVVPFEPERFHIERLSSLGVFSGRDGEQNRIRLQRVTPAQLRALGDIVWVERVEPME